MKTTLLFIAFVLAASSACHSQRSSTLTLGIQVAVPVGEFGQVYSGTPVGLAGQFLHPVQNNLPFELGVGYSWNSMGSTSKDVSILIGTDEFGDDIYESGKLYMNSNANRFYLAGRLRPFNGKVQPYGDLVSGVATYRTKTTVDVVTNSTGYSSGNNAETQQFDWTLYYGWSAGIRFRVKPHLLLDFRFENLVGGAATYVDTETIAINAEDDIAFETKTSKTDQFTYQVGLTIDF